jgi:hypothetical protein
MNARLPRRFSRKKLFNRKERRDLRDTMWEIEDRRVEMVGLAPASATFLATCLPHAKDAKDAKEGHWILSFTGDCPDAVGRFAFAGVRLGVGERQSGLAPAATHIEASGGSTDTFFGHRECKKETKRKMWFYWAF